MAIKQAIEDIKESAHDVGERFSTAVSKWMPWQWGKRRARTSLPQRASAGPADLMSIRDEFDRLFERMQQSITRFGDDWFADFHAPLDLLDTGWPKLDVEETDKAYRVKAEVPGLDEKDIDVSVDGNTLVISGERREERETDQRGVHRVESYYGSFHRSVPLPTEIDPDEVTAKYKRGELIVTLPKKHTGTTARKRIEVK